MLLVTGGAGFIGLNFVKYLLNKGITDIAVVDKFTYAANVHALVNIDGLDVIFADIANADAMHNVFKDRKITTVINFAAESHVDNSIKDWRPFLKSNVEGTLVLLEKSLEFGVNKFIQISTDEVFGEVLEGSFNELSPIAHRNPYSASKAAAEHFAMSFYHTHGLPVVIINSSNNYGPYQHKEKFIPTIVRNILAGKKVPVYGQGSQIRDWLFVQDTCSAIETIIKHGRVGDRYCIGGDYNDITNLDLVHMILDAMHADRNAIEFVKDRPGHDQRYSIDFSKIQRELGWQPTYTLEQGLKETIQWIKENENRI
jgi:dTDP-glucose 4,6-dehydratase